MVAGLVGIFAMDASQGQVGESFGGSGVEQLSIEADRPEYVFEDRLDLVEQALGRDEDYVEQSLGPGDGSQHVNFLLAAIGRSRVERAEKRRLARDFEAASVCGRSADRDCFA